MSDKPFKWPSTEPKPDGKGFETLMRVAWEEYFRVLHSCKSERQRAIWRKKLRQIEQASKTMELTMAQSAGWEY